MTKVACIGEAMIELSLSDSSAQVGVAGDTLNTAIYLKRAAPDLEVDYIMRLGDEAFSDRIRDFIANEDLGISRISTQDGGTPGMYAISTDDDGERSFTYWRSAAAARGLFGDHDFTALEGFDLIYLSGISLAILPQTVRLTLLDWIKSSGIDLAYDSNYRPRLWEDAQTARAVNTAFWETAQIAMPSIDDEMELFGETMEQTEARWAKASCTGALKRGAQGPLSIGADIVQRYLPAPKVVDTTAAGDSFNGGYLASYLTGGTHAEALLAGHNMAAEVVQRRGAIIPR